ncbi:MAG: hypothetical protein A3I78_05055 [Gammaproteobacteria bacterium RIFCSPLOWO2_02_FULL_56_15]|nr:MAG: hypothetical protein A3I78_05055 [Gammaproteobacteria bacterium RIFCSPLOWO2_02_FULL_56_15]HLF30896.1 zinc ribbon domain-containing protein [Xanthomonadales bacterium]
MPIYEYQCGQCNHKLEAIHKFSDTPMTECPECGESSLRKLVSAASFRLKGTGWYATDFKDQQAKKGNGAAKSESAEGKDGAVAASPGEKDSKEAAAGKSAAASTDSKSEAATDKSAAASTDSKPVAAAKSGAE